MNVTRRGGAHFKVSAGMQRGTQGERGDGVTDDSLATDQAVSLGCQCFPVFSGGTATNTYF